MNKILIILLSLVFIFSCGDDNKDKEEVFNTKDKEEVFNTTDYVYVIVNIAKTTNLPDREKRYFKVNGKTEKDTEKTFNYINSLLTKQGYPFGFRIGNDDEVFALKIKAKSILEVIDDYKIKITSDDDIICVKEFEQIGLGDYNPWCRIGDKSIDITKEDDFKNIKLVYISISYKHGYDNCEYSEIVINGFMHDKLTGKPGNHPNALECSDNRGVCYTSKLKCENEFDEN